MNKENKVKWLNKKLMRDGMLQLILRQNR